MTANVGEEFSVVVPFPPDLSDDEAAGIKDIAIREWHDRLTEAGAVRADEDLHVHRLDPPEVDGERLSIGYTDEDGVDHEAPPISAWRVWGMVRR